MLSAPGDLLFVALWIEVPSIHLISLNSASNLSRSLLYCVYTKRDYSNRIDIPFMSAHQHVFTL